MEIRVTNRPRGTETGLRALFDQHGPAVLAYASRLTGSRQTGEDVVQETMFRAWLHPECFGEGAFSTRAWLFRVARNIVFDQSRSRSRRPPEASGEMVDLIAVPDGSERVVDTLVAQEALGRVSAPHRDVLVQLYLKERTVAEAAEELGIPEGTVRSRCFYALRTLRFALRVPGSLSPHDLTHAPRDRAAA